jgi:diacylglycerol kinase family enzyme
MPLADPAQPTAPQRISTAQVVVNIASGGVGPDAAERLARIGATFGLEMSVALAAPAELRMALEGAIAAAPDLLVIVAGDGTAALAAELCGSDGPVLAPLPGGTMNMLPRALYGARAWPQALEDSLRGGRVVDVSGGEVSGHPFHVAAILGEPALWAEAREAMRRRRPRLALLHARRAWMRTFSGRLRFSLDGGEPRKAAALTLMCPLISRALSTDGALEAAALDPHDAIEGFRLGLAALMGRWRQDPAVMTQLCSTGRAWAKGRIPVILDGEPHRFASPFVFRYRSRAFRALAPADYRPLEKGDDVRAGRAGA